METPNSFDPMSSKTMNEAMGIATGDGQAKAKNIDARRGVSNVAETKAKEEKEERSKEAKQTLKAHQEARKAFIEDREEVFELQESLQNAKDSNMGQDKIARLTHRLEWATKNLKKSERLHESTLKHYELEIRLYKDACEAHERAMKRCETPENAQLSTPMDQSVFNKLQAASPLAAVVRETCDHIRPEIRNPWQESPQEKWKPQRENEMRKRCSKHWGQYKQKKNLARCSITGEWGDCNTVIGAHLLPLRTTAPMILKSLNMKGKLNDMKNVIPLLKTIERAFDNQRLCVILADGESTPPKYQIRIFDESLKGEEVHGALTFEELAETTFEMPQDKEGEGPFTRCLSYHAKTGYNRAMRKGWIKVTDPSPDEYGSPVDKETISVLHDSTSVTETSTSIS